MSSPWLKIIEDFNQKTSEQKKYQNDMRRGAVTSGGPSFEGIEKAYEAIYDPKYDDAGSLYDPRKNAPDPSDEEAYREWLKSIGIAGPTFNPEKGGYDNPPVEDESDNNYPPISIEDVASKWPNYEDPESSSKNLSLYLALGIAVFLILALK